MDQEVRHVIVMVLNYIWVGCWLAYAVLHEGASSWIQVQHISGVSSSSGYSIRQSSLSCPWINIRCVVNNDYLLHYPGYILSFTPCWYLIKIRRPTNPCNISIIVFFLFKLLRGLSVNEMLLAWITLDMNKVVTAVQHIAGPEQNTSWWAVLVGHTLLPITFITMS